MGDSVMRGRQQRLEDQWVQGSSEYLPAPSAEGFAAAVDVGYDMVRYDLLNKINQTLDRDHASSAPAAAQEAVS